ncbi:MAG TPA: hypothetical protein ENH31_06075 [Nitrospirae bacterium]|nr:hypothetical protein BMS3Abin10_01171 [bacterium BMS3Abin10]GBE38676.1 hypothetical protein BMS3Bbin08_01284 [bacterium BMS3Bbin08]HDK17424.1 hypothetical protein [Nitrospirota bacterium]HDK41138.1 hypothetical protein [Nitrospirota bacterium]HDK82123.1 hypothetical protein [Nitrospirota bacterium]
MPKWFYFPFSLLLFVFYSPLPVHAADMTPQQLVKEARVQVKAVSIHNVKRMMDSREKIIILRCKKKG